MSNINESLKNLAQMMATFNFHQGKKVSYAQIERFLKKSFKTGPMIIVSLPLDQKVIQNKTDLSSVRFLWNKRAYGAHYPKSDIDKVVVTIFEQDDSKFSFSKMKIEDREFVLIKIGSFTHQMIYGIFEEKEDIEEELLNLFAVFMANVSKGWTLLDELKKVENLIHMDDVTGLYNQRKLLKDLDMAISRYKELKEEFSILFIDIDHFKQVNDGHGHLVGTHLLTAMGELLKKTLRESDLIYRYGGDEFVMLIPDVGHEIGKTIGERVLKSVKKEIFNITSQKDNTKTDQFNLTVSIGVASYPKDASNKEDILSIADRMMYEAKKGGRGRVCFTSDIL
jgi:diguanylate cyclase (GGDEF)-like protein